MEATQQFVSDSWGALWGLGARALLQSIDDRLGRIEASVNSLIVSAPASIVISQISRKTVESLVRRFNIREDKAAFLPADITRSPRNDDEKARSDGIDWTDGELAARGRYKVYFENLIKEFVTQDPFYVELIDNHRSLLTTPRDHPVVPIQMRGTSDLVIHSGGRWKKFHSIRLVVQLKVSRIGQTEATNQQMDQAFAELFASNTKTRSVPVVVLLTDVNNFWVYHWFSLIPAEDGRSERVYNSCCMSKNAGAIAFEQILSVGPDVIKQLFATTSQLFAVEPVPLPTAADVNSVVANQTPDDAMGGPG